ncbi:MAG: Ig-like domain repeat protein [Candidatus Methanoplasma sp.]|jgi:hypothetical protein|nr:Ig-like domain repeat protein [Candidatus Methanoplasma sp.]
MKINNNLKKYVLSAVLVLALLAGAAVWAEEAQVSDAATLTVTSGGNSGPGTLRNVIGGAANGDVIVFAPGVTTVTLISEIPFSQTNITIDGGSGVTITKNASLNFRLLTSAATTGTLTLKNLTIENGRAIGTYGAGEGGGVYGRNITLENCTFQNNTASYAGGGLCSSGIVNITDCTFTNNHTIDDYGQGGGGVCVYNPGTATMTNCTFIGNSTAWDGGAAYAYYATITDCTFIDNAAKQDGGALHMYSSAVVTNCVFTGNTVMDDAGGAVYVEVGATITDCTFTDNTAPRGGAVCLNRDNNFMINCTLSGNTATNSTSGTVHIGEIGTNRAGLFHCTVTDNFGMGIYANTASTAYLYNCILIGNTLSQIGGSGTVNTSFGNLVQGMNIPGSSSLVTYEGAFGTSAFDPVAGVHMVLSNGPAARNAVKIGAGDISTAFTLARRNLAVTLLERDQTGELRPSPLVTYGAVESKNSSTTITASPASPQPYGTPVTITAQVSSSIGTPVGTVEFFDGTVSLGTAVLSDGSASIFVSDLPIGTRSLTAIYGGSDISHFGSKSSAAAYVVIEAATLTLTAKPSSSGTFEYRIGSGTWNAYSLPLIFVKGATVEIRTIGAGMDFSHWESNTAAVPASFSSAVASNTFVMNDDYDLTAVFFNASVPGSGYTLELGSVGTGDIDLTVGGMTETVTVPFSHGFAAGTSVTVAASAVSPWQFSNWSVSGTIPASFSALSQTNAFAMDDDLGLTAVFFDRLAPGSYYVLRINVTGAGSIGLMAGGTTEAIAVPFSHDFAAGTSVTATASATLPWAFSDWRTTGAVPALFSRTSAPNTFAVNADYNLTASFYNTADVGSESSLIIVGGSVVKTYGDPKFTLVVKGGPVGIVKWISNHPELVEVDPSTGEVTIKGATNNTLVSITATKSGLSTSITVTVNKKPVTVTADDKTKRAGEADPLLTYTVSPAPLARDVLGGSLKHNGKGPGTYDIVEDAFFAVDPNYEVTFVKGTMTITDDGIPWLWIIILIVVILAALIAILWYRRRHKN